MPCYELDGLVPVIDPTAFVHPDAILIGDVIIGPGCYVGPAASLRGDLGRIILERGANVQDACVLHSFPDRDMLVEENGHIGHAAVLHCCTVRRDALVGIQAVLMDAVVVGEQAIVGACSFVPEGVELPPRTLSVGSPARVLRELTEAQLAAKRAGTEVYHRLAERCLQSFRPVTPLSAPEPGRPRLDLPYVSALGRR